MSDIHLQCSVPLRRTLESEERQLEARAAPGGSRGDSTHASGRMEEAEGVDSYAASVVQARSQWWFTANRSEHANTELGRFGKRRPAV